MGIANKVGSIEAGKEADLVALNLNLPHTTSASTKPELEEILASLVYACDARNVVHTWVAGRQLVRNGELLVADIRDVSKRVHKSFTYPDNPQ